MARFYDHNTIQQTHYQSEISIKRFEVAHGRTETILASIKAVQFAQIELNE